jgi:hypothetical protein
MTAVSARAAIRGGRVWVRAVRILAVLTVVAALGFTGWYRHTYNVWPGQDASTRVHWCGRDYATGGGTLTWKEISSPRSPVQAVAQYPPLGWSRQELLAVVTPPAERYAVSPPLPCAMGIYLRIGRNEYRAYGLLGGP